MSEATHHSMDAPAESSAVASQTPAPKKRRNHRRAHKLYDRRFAVGRRIKELTLTFCQRLSPDADHDPLLFAAIDRAAQLQALAEQAAARALRADPAIAYDDVVRLSRLADQAVRRLRLDERNPTKTSPTLADYLHGRAP